MAAGAAERPAPERGNAGARCGPRPAAAGVTACEQAPDADGAYSDDNAGRPAGAHRCAGNRPDKRWQGVADLLGAGIDVITSLNVQHLESPTTPWRRSLTSPRETVPDAVLPAADRVELIDISPQQLRDRISRGVVRRAGRTEPPWAAAMRNSRASTWPPRWLDYARPESARQLVLGATRWSRAGLCRLPR